ncbi:MAG TPA: tRNA uridine-5-carboxymethylaminomethyl(34) synthesis GTPase MnmE [Nitrospiria bacterium]|nr:tRNA uridine-5-carboxymethylaminomethyl(34) synthesis GTPase MnmE [Nitrospiria bacterium]
MDDGIRDTICAISTPIGEGGIGIIRISGPMAIRAADPIFRIKTGLKVSELSTHTIHYGEIIDPDSKEVIDEALLSIMRAPRTYTREDIVEINCHGGPLPIKRTLDLIIRMGARLAEPGEFTKRAYLSGRIDLTRAEAVMDIIRAKSDAALKAATTQLKGRLYEEISGIRERLFDILSFLEVNIDFPEEDIEAPPDHSIRSVIPGCIEWIDNLIRLYEGGRILREGYKIAIAGRPNVGKSSLLNRLLGKERAIVSPIPGTTRDLIDEFINIRGIPVRLIDMAGIRGTIDPIELEGVKRAKGAMDEADLLFIMLDATDRLYDDERKIINETKGRRRLVILNKIDLPVKIDLKEIDNLLSDDKLLTISATEGIGIAMLEASIYSLAVDSGIGQIESGITINLRHKDLLLRSNESLKRTVSSLALGATEEFLAIDIRDAIDLLGEIIGEKISDDLLERIFSRFCIGK